MTDDKLFTVWKRLADNWTPASKYTLQDLAPPGVSCPTCWDFGVCPECLGEQSGCAALCKNGRCPDCDNDDL